MEQLPHKKDSEMMEEIRMLRELDRNRFGNEKFMQQVSAFADHLRETYPDWQRRRAYHALAGSSVIGEDEVGIIEEDFPGDDSVVQFLHSLAIS